MDKPALSTATLASGTLAGSNINHVKAHNLRAVLLNLLHNGSISRVQLAEQTALSNTTITNITAALLAQGVIVEEATAVPNNGQTRRRVGRPRRMLSLLPNARYVVGVHVGIGIYRVAITNLFAEIIHTDTVHFPIDTPTDTVLADMAAAIEAAVIACGIDPQDLLGVGVGLSGLVDYDTGVNVLAPNLGWHNVPVRHTLHQHLNWPVIVDNNVRAMALGEAFFGIGQQAKVLAFIYGRFGVGAGFVVNGKPYRGGGAGAGEIGHMIMIPNGGATCRCGQTGCLETLIAEPVLLQEANALADRYPEGLLAQKRAAAAKQTADKTAVSWLFDAAREGDEIAQQMLNERAHYLGLALANLVNILNPELILLGGLFAQAHDLLQPTAEATMRQTAFAGLGKKVTLRPTPFGWRAGIIGAASLALNTFFYQQGLQQ